MFLLLQALNMSEAEFRTIVIRVVLIGLVTMGSSFVILMFFWKNLEKESEAGETKVRKSTVAILVGLILTLVLMSVLVYQF